MNFHECSWVFTVFYQGFDHGHMLYTAGPPQAASVLHCSWKQGTLPNMLLWQTNDTSAAPKPNLRTNSHVTVMLVAGVNPFSMCHRSYPTHAATRSAFTSLSSKQQRSTQPTPARLYGWKTSASLLNGDGDGWRLLEMMYMTANVNFCRDGQSMPIFVEYFTHRLTLLPPFVEVVSVFSPSQRSFQKILKKIKNAHSLGPVRMQGPFPPQPTKHPRQLDSWTASNCGQLDRLDSPAFAARLADRLKSRHGELVTAGSAVSPFFFVDMFGWIAWSRKKYIMIQRLYLTKRHENRNVTQNQNRTVCDVNGFSKPARANLSVSFTNWDLSDSQLL